MPAHAEIELKEIGQRHFGGLLSRPGAWAFWWPRFERIARWFAAEEAIRRPGLIETASEVDGSLIVAAPAGPFTIFARADRVERGEAGALSVIDYKTGSVPDKAAIEAAIAVQLPLEGAIARAGGFGAPGSLAALEHWKLGGSSGGERLPLGKDDPAALVDLVLAEICALIARFDDPRTPYRPVPVARWQPRYSDYTHLERLDESETG